MSMATQTILDGTLTPRTWVQYQMWFHQRMSELMMLAVAFSIPLATTAAEVLLCLYLYFYISALGFGQKLRLIFSNRISQCFLLMCGLMLVGMAWSSGSWNETLRGLSKHREFLYMPLFLTSLRKEWVRTWGIRMFMVGATTLLALSYIEWIFGLDLELASTVGLGEGASAGYVIFKDRIVHSLLIAFLAFLYANLFLDKPAWRPWAAVAILLCLANLFFLVQGRTGYLVLIVLTVLLLIQRCGLRGLAYAAIVVPCLGTAAYLSSEVVRDRVQATIVQLKNQFGPEKRRSPDPRLEFYETSLAIWKQHPWIGAGTGGFAREYAAQSAIMGTPRTDDPHCEYLVIAVQWGLAGLAIFGFLLLRMITTSRELPTAESRVAQAMLITVLSGGLFNSLLLGFTGGLLFSYFSALCFAALPETNRVLQPGTVPGTERSPTRSPEATPAPTVPAMRAA